MRWDDLPGNWFDVLVILLLLIGLWRGHKRGMSEELLGILPWLAGVVVAGNYYGLAGDLLAPTTRMRADYNNVIGYLFIVLLIFLMVSLIKRVVGEKPMSSELFGRLEHVLGMLSGMLRYMCVVVMVVALLSAVVFTPQEVLSQRAGGNTASGSPVLPGFAAVHYEIMQNSAGSHFIQEHLPTLLIKPTYAKEVPARESLRKKAEKELNRVIENK